MRDQIMVSVICATYNHKEYIREAIEGVLNQKTQYNYELIIHDDASTDGTREIVEEYASKYPDRVVALLEEENQYSKGIDVGSLFLPYIRGRYVADCDGDDQWIDTFKLQKQVDYMLEHPKTISCFTNALVKDYRNTTEYTRCKWKRNHYVGYTELYDKEMNIILPTSYIIRASDYIDDNAIIAKLGGYNHAAIQRWMVYKNERIYYMSDITIMYRSYVPGSWNWRFQINGEFSNENELEKEREDTFNEITHYKYDRRIQKKRNLVEYRRINNYYRNIDLLACIGIKRMLKVGAWDLAIAVMLFKYFPIMYGTIRRLWRKVIGEEK